MLDLSYQVSQNKFNQFKFEAKWLLYDDFFGRFKNVWSNFIEGFPAYQVTRKTQVVTKSIKYRKKDKVSNSEKKILRMKEVLETYKHH